MTVAPDIAEWPDTRLVQECREGNAAAWDALIVRYGPLIYGIARRFRLTPEDCVDVFSQVCKILLENLGKLRSSERLAGYIATTTHRACLAIRREQDRQTKLAHRVVQEEIQPLALDVDPDQVARETLRAHLVRQALHVQDVRCRELLTLLFFSDDQPNYDEISARLQLPVPSIGPTRGRCLEKFRRTLKTLGFEE